MSDEHLEPARTVIAKLGGVDAVSKITGKHVSRVYRWMYPKTRGGTGGLIPQAEAPTLLKHAHENDINLTPADFFAVPEPTEGAAA